MCAYKHLKGVGMEYRAWDRANWARYSRPATKLLDSCAGGVVEAIEWLEAFKSRMDAASRDWTLDTAARLAWDDRELAEVRNVKST